MGCNEEIATVESGPRMGVLSTLPTLQPCPIILARQAIRSSLSLLVALSPVDVNLLGEGDSRIIVGDLATGCAVGAGERNAVVDVEDAVSAARREDEARSGNLVVLGVNLARGPDTAALDRRLRRRGRRGVLAEVVGAIKGSSNTLVELSVAVVCAVDDRELEAAGVLEVQVQLAVLGLLSRADTRSNVGLELVKAESDDSLVGRDAGRHSSLRATIAGEAGADDLDLARIGLVSPSVGARLCHGAGGGQDREEEGGERTHLEVDVEEDGGRSEDS